MDLQLNNKTALVTGASKGNQLHQEWGGVDSHHFARPFRQEVVQLVLSTKLHTSQKADQYGNQVAHSQNRKNTYKEFGIEGSSSNYRIFCSVGGVPGSIWSLSTPELTNA